MMQVKLSYDLRMKLISLEYNDISLLNFNDYYDIEFDVDLEDEKLVQECRIWLHHSETYFKTSYRACQIDIGHFVGLWPIKAYDKSTLVLFRADHFDPKRKDWKDWFIEEIEDAPKFLT